MAVGLQWNTIHDEDLRYSQTTLERVREKQGIINLPDFAGLSPRLSLISDAHEWINEIPTVPNDHLTNPQPRERAWQNQRGKKTLLSLEEE